MSEIDNTTTIEYPTITDFEYEYDICYLASSCENCGVRLHLNIGVYEVKDNSLSLCDVCYWRIKKEHNKRGITDWQGTLVYEREEL
jgi:hypothetical protein